MTGLVNPVIRKNFYTRLVRLKAKAMVTHSLTHWPDESSPLPCKIYHGTNMNLHVF